MTRNYKKTAAAIALANRHATIQRVKTLAELTTAFHNGAFAVVINRPATRKALDEIVALFGTPGINNVFAAYRDIRHDPSALVSLAKSLGAHPLHTDGTFMDAPPTVFLLQVLKTDIGYAGMGLFLSTQEVLEAMPSDMKKLLMEQPLIFSRQREGSGATDDHIGPMIYIAEDGGLSLRWRFDHLVRPEIPVTASAVIAAQLEVAIQWVKDFIERSALTALMYREGDIVVVRNTRCLHGRSELSPSSDRHMVRVWLTGIRPGWLKAS